MFSRILKKATRLSHPSVRFAFASTSQGGNLYTWGTRAAGLGYVTHSTSLEIETPHRVEGFENNVSKVAMGPSHTAVITTDGDLYTFGYGSCGVLGHNEGDYNQFTPKVVQYFKEHNLKVKDVVVGRSHTAAITDNGSVYTWGFGGKSANPLRNWFAPSFGALGLGSNENRYVPTLVESLNDVSNKNSLTSGYNFCAVLTGENDIYNWGVGYNSVLANDTNANLKAPALNEAVKHLAEDEGIKCVKIKACADQILALFDNGILYGWGNNELAQLGVPKQIGIETIYDVIHHPTKINDSPIKGKRIIDFDIGEEISAILTDTNEVYWVGLKLAYQYDRIDFPEGKKIKKIAVANPWVVAITEDNEVYSNSYISPETEDDPHTGIFKFNDSAFNGGQVLDLGGQYINRFAIVRN